MSSYAILFSWSSFPFNRALHPDVMSGLANVYLPFFIFFDDRSSKRYTAVCLSTYEKRQIFKLVSDRVCGMYETVRLFLR